MKHRIERVKEVLRRELSELIRKEVAFKSALITVQDVDLTTDLKHCHVYVSAIGAHVKPDSLVALLEEKRKFLQQEIGKRVVLKYTPQLHFKFDTALERGTRVIGIMDELGLNETNEEK